MIAAVSHAAPRALQNNVACLHAAVRAGGPFQHPWPESNPATRTAPFPSPAVPLAYVLERKRRDKPSLRPTRQRALRANGTHNPEGLDSFDRLLDGSEYLPFRNG